MYRSFYSTMILLSYQTFHSHVYPQLMVNSTSTPTTWQTSVSYVCLWSRTYFLNTKSYERYQLCFIPSYVQGPQSYVAPALKLNLEISSSFNLAGIPSISTIPSETHLESFLQQQVIIRLTLIRAQC